MPRARARSSAAATATSFPRSSSSVPSSLSARYRHRRARPELDRGQPLLAAPSWRSRSSRWRSCSAEATIRVREASSSSTRTVFWSSRSAVQAEPGEELRILVERRFVEERQRWLATSANAGDASFRRLFRQLEQATVDVDIRMAPAVPQGELEGRVAERLAEERLQPPRRHGTVAHAGDGAPEGRRCEHAPAQLAGKKRERDGEGGERRCDTELVRRRPVELGDERVARVREGEEDRGPQQRRDDARAQRRRPHLHCEDDDERERDQLGHAGRRDGGRGGHAVPRGDELECVVGQFFVQSMSGPPWKRLREDEDEGPGGNRCAHGRSEEAALEPGARTLAGKADEQVGEVQDQADEHEAPDRNGTE